MFGGIIESAPIPARTTRTLSGFVQFQVWRGLAVLSEKLEKELVKARKNNRCLFVSWRKMAQCPARRSAKLCASAKLVLLLQAASLRFELILKGSHNVPCVVMILQMYHTELHFLFED